MDKNQLEETRFDYLSLNNGKRISILEPEQDTMDIITIANSLSNLCRFMGQVNDFYSVAQHSVMVSHLVPTQHAYAGLMHDATEAFCGDLVKPIKQKLPEYSVIEERMWNALRQRYNLPMALPSSVHVADRIMVKTESRDLQTGDIWKSWYPDFQPLPFPIIPLLPKDAFTLFLARHAELTGEPCE